ncbi:MAG: sugar transferase [Patescibacteria group bacterium]
MSTAFKVKQLILVGGDIIVLFLSLLLTLFVRYNTSFNNTILNEHLSPFSLLFFLWITIFYIAGLYDLKYLKNDIVFFKKFSAALAVNASVAITAFYFLPVGITPKTNLLILIIIFSALEYFWRRIFNKFLSGQAPATNILLIGSGETNEEIEKQVKSNPQLGYAIKFWMKEGLGDAEMAHLNQIIIAEKIDLIVIPSHLKRNSRAARAIYRNLALGIQTADVASFYETIFGKVPLVELEEVWFLENLLNRHKIYESIKQPIEIVFALALTALLSPLLLIIALLVKITSVGSILYKQQRIGQYEATFTLYKFRTMVKDAEKSGAQWAQPNDRRVTAIGQFLRRTHLDELPQLINIIKGELSCVGPRPERPEFTEKLKETIPHYELRHLIRPGLAGWAQLNYRYGASVEDAYNKLQYEIYYLKNHSFWMDVGIVLKTLKLFFVKN